MKIQKMDVFVYLPSANSKEERSSIIKSLVNLTGVKMAGDNQYVNKMLNVAYDPLLTSCSNIIDHIRQQGSRGYLVGL